MARDRNIAAVMVTALVLLLGYSCMGAAADGGPSCNAQAANMVSGPPAFRECRLQYYVQVLVGDVSLNQNLLPALNPSYSGPFGHAELFAFNATAGPERESALVGTVRGFTIDSAYKASDIVDLIEVELIAYDDGMYKGTIQIQGEIRATPSPDGNEVAIVGGTGSFRGARGFGFIARLLLDGPYRLFHHDLHFLY